MNAERVLGPGGDGALGVYNDFKIIERVQGKLIFALEALRMHCRRGRPDLTALARYSAIDRVTVVMRPYLEALL